MSNIDSNLFSEQHQVPVIESQVLIKKNTRCILNFLVKNSKLILLKIMIQSYMC